MNEIFTKKFWEGVKKTFDDALEGRDNAAPSAAESGVPTLKTEPQAPISTEPPQSN